MTDRLSGGFTVREREPRLHQKADAATGLSAAWEFVPGTREDPLIVVRYAGVYPRGSAGNEFANAMSRFLVGALFESKAAAVIFDMTALDYRWGDSICALALPLLDAERRFRPAAIVATGGTADALCALMSQDTVLGMANVKLFQAWDEALSQVGLDLRARRDVAPAPGALRRPGSSRTPGFPDLAGLGFEAFSGATISVIVGTLLLAFGGTSIVLRVLAALMYVPAALYVVLSAVRLVGNSVARFRWSRRFARRVNYLELRVLFRTDPGRLLVHIRQYGVALDESRHCPAAFVEDLSTGDFAAVYPSFSGIYGLCKSFHVDVRSYT